MTVLSIKIPPYPTVSGPGPTEFLGLKAATLVIAEAFTTVATMESTPSANIVGVAQIGLKNLTTFWGEKEIGISFYIVHGKVLEHSVARLRHGKETAS